MNIKSLLKNQEVVWFKKNRKIIGTILILLGIVTITPIIDLPKNLTFDQFIWINPLFVGFVLAGLLCLEK